MLGPSIRAFLRAMLAVAVAFVLLPITVVVGASFGPTLIPIFPPSGLTLRWFHEALAKPVFVEAAQNSLWLAVLATLINIPIAFAAAQAVVRAPRSVRAILEGVLLAPLTTPAFVLSLAILIAASQFSVNDPIARLLLGHVMVTFPYLLRALVAGLQQSSAEVADAARTLGASPIKVAIRVTIPSVRPNLLAGIVFAFLISFDNVAISLFLSSTRTNTLPIALLNYVEYNFDPSVLAVSTLLVFLSFGLLFLMERLTGLQSIMAK